MTYLSIPYVEILITDSNKNNSFILSSYFDNKPDFLNNFNKINSNINYIVKLPSAHQHSNFVLKFSNSKFVTITNKEVTIPVSRNILKLEGAS